MASGISAASGAGGTLRGSISSDDGWSNVPLRPEHAPVDGDVRCANLHLSGQIVDAVHACVLSMHGGAPVACQLRRAAAEPGCFIWPRLKRDLPQRSIMS